MILRAKKSLTGLQQHVSWIQRPQHRGEPHENGFKRLIHPFFPNRGPRGGGGDLPDCTRRGTNYLHTTLLKTIPKSNCLDTDSIFFDSAPPK